MLYPLSYEGAHPRGPAVPTARERSQPTAASVVVGRAGQATAWGLAPKIPSSVI